MIKLMIITAIVLSAFGAIAQNSNSSSILVHHDTTLLKAEDCEWIIKSLVKNEHDLTSPPGKSVSLIIMDAIEKGKLKAFDRVTNTPIPADKISTWQMPADSIMTHDDAGNAKVSVVQRRHTSDHLNRIRIYHDWYFDVSTGKLQSVIKWIELMEEIHTSTGFLLGYAPLCRIYY